MALGDKQVLNPSVADGSSDYLIPGAVSLQLKAVSAEFTDNGAAGDWLPAVVAISDSGHVFWRACEQGVKVTAGADAEVSWFPRLRTAAAAPATSGGFAYSRGYTNSLSGDANIVVPPHGNIRAPFAHVDADATGKITWTTTVNPNDTAVLHGPGVGLFLSTVQFASYALGIAGFAYDLSGDQLPHMSWGGQGILDTPALTSGIGLPTDEDFTCVRVPSGGTENVSLLLQQNSGVNLNCQQAFMSILFFVGA